MRAYSCLKGSQGPSNGGHIASASDRPHELLDEQGCLQAIAGNEEDGRVGLPHLTATHPGRGVASKGGAEHKAQVKQMLSRASRLLDCGATLTRLSAR